MTKNIFLEIVDNKSTQRFIAWCLIALMMFGIVPMSPLQIHASESVVEDTYLEGKIDAGGGSAQITLNENTADRLDPVIKSKKSNGPNGTSAHIAWYDTGNFKGYGYCIQHTNPHTASNMAVTVKKANDDISVTTKNIFYLGASSGEVDGDAAADYVRGLVDAANKIVSNFNASHGTSYAPLCDDALLNHYLNNMDKAGAWKKATQLAIWMSLMTGGQRQMAVEGQLTYQGGAIFPVDVASAYDSISYSDNNSSDAKAVLGIAKALYFMGACGEEKGWDITQRNPDVQTYALHGITDLQDFYDNSVAQQDFKSAKTDGTGNIANAFAKLQSESKNGIIKQTVDGKECYVIYYASVLATQPNGNITVSISDESENVPAGTFLAGLDASVDSIPGLDVAMFAMPDKKGDSISAPYKAMVKAGENLTDADYGITDMPSKGEYDPDTKYCFPMYYKICIPTSSVGADDNTPVKIAIDTECTSAMAYQTYVGEHSTYQNFLLGDTTKTVNTSAAIVWAGGSVIPSSIRKVDQSGKGLAGAELTFSGAGGTKAFTSGSNGNVNVQWTNASGANYLAPGTYTVQETKAPAGCELDNTPQTVTLNADGSSSPTAVTFTNTKGNGGGGGHSMIMKVDQDGQPLGGAVFHIWSSAASTSDTTIMSEPDGSVPIQWTDPSGANYVEPGTYMVEEVKAPTGYNLDSSGPKSITLNFDGSSSGQLVFTNTRKPTLLVCKIDENGNPLPGAYFKVYKDGQPFGDYGPTGTDGKVEVGAPDGLENGYYEAEEITAPAGYVRSTERKGVNVDFDNNHYTLETSSLLFQNFDGSSIHILKKDDSGNGLRGAVFEVQIDGTVIGSYASGGDGSVTISYDELKEHLDLSKNSWTVGVREVTPPTGYLLNDTNWHFAEMRLGEDPKQFVFTDSKYPRIEIVKLENGTTTGLPGAVFEVAIDGTSIGTDFTSGADGKIVIDYEHYSRFLGDAVNQADKVWDVAVREITAPDGYLIDNDDWQHAQLKLGQTLAPFTFTDSKYPDIKIIKLDKETGERLPNTSFRIQIDGTSFIAEKKTDEKGEIVITYAEFGHFLTEAGDKDRDSWTITVTELEPTQFYNKDKQQTSGDYTQTQQLKHGQALSVFEFKDTHYRDIKVFKRDSETNWLLKGATFRLHCVAAENKDAGNITDRELTTDEKGYVIFENIPNGTYELTEIAAPFGYDNNSEKKTVIVTSDNDRVIEFEFKNAPKSGLLIRKIDSVTKQPLANVEFRITPLAPLDSPSWTAVTDDNGLIVKENLAAGTYRIEEITTVDGYVLNDKAQLIEIKNQHDAYTVTFENNQKNMLNILKLDAITGLPLPGAIFEVSTAGGTHVANVTTGAFGYASLPNLKPGSYVVKEVKAPEGHIIDPTIKTFEITEDDSGQVITLVFDNSPYTDLYIRKYDAFTNIGLEDAHFKVWKDNTLIADDVTSDEGGFIHIGKQTAGMFQIQEIRAPKGYTLDETVHTIYLKDGETGTIEIPNNKPGGLAIHKTDVKTGESLAGTTFELRTIEGTLIGSKVTGKDGYVRWEQLEPGWYVVTETGAPEGYIVSHKSMNVEVKEFESTEIEWVDDQNASLTIVKRDKDSEVPLKGAIFEIRSMSGDVVERVTTGANGVATTGLLEAGWYRIVEVKAPDGYILNEEEQMVEVKLNTPASVDFFNVKQKGITIHKVDALTNDPLAGATFDVRTAADKLIESYTTDASGVITTKALDPGVKQV